MQVEQSRWHSLTLISTAASICPSFLESVFLPLICTTYLCLFSFHIVHIQDEYWVESIMTQTWPASTSSKPSKRGMAQSQSDSLINLEELPKSPLELITCYATEKSTLIHMNSSPFFLLTATLLRILIYQLKHYFKGSVAYHLVEAAGVSNPTCIHHSQWIPTKLEGRWLYTAQHTSFLAQNRNKDAKSSCSDIQSCTWS